MCFEEPNSCEDIYLNHCLHTLFFMSRGMGMEVCCTLGMLEQKQAEQLKAAGLTAYNHNLDTSREYYPNIITTRSYDERLKTLELVRDAGISVCSGAIPIFRHPSLETWHLRFFSLIIYIYIHIHLCTFNYAAFYLLICETGSSYRVYRRYNRTW